MNAAPHTACTAVPHATHTVKLCGESLAWQVAHACTGHAHAAAAWCNRVHPGNVQATKGAGGAGTSAATEAEADADARGRGGGGGGKGMSVPLTPGSTVAAAPAAFSVAPRPIAGAGTGKVPGC